MLVIDDCVEAKTWYGTEECLMVAKAGNDYKVFVLTA